MQICLLTSPAKFHTGLHLLSLICRNACPVRRDFGDLAFPQGEELIPHIDILLSSPEGNRTVWMMPFPSFGCPLDGFLLFLLHSFQSPLSVLPENRGCRSVRPLCHIGDYASAGFIFFRIINFAITTTAKRISITIPYTKMLVYHGADCMAYKPGCVLYSQNT